MTREQSASTTIDASVVERHSHVATTCITLVFRWAGGRELVDFDRARAVTIGRGQACDVRIDDHSLSRQHARFVREGDTLRVEDLNSRNGVLIRGRRCKSAVVDSGDLVTLGHVTASVHIFAAQSGSMLPGVEHAGISWTDAGMSEVLRIIGKIAPTPLPVLVFGETGVGKELVAHEIHRASDRAKAPMRVINCAAIPTTLIESTLFGHERGSFTGADKAQPGVFEQAQGGTVFLDEIGELSPPAQAALLRVLESGRCARIGSSRDIEVDVRIVAATHRDLNAMERSGTFRLDLLHRLMAVELHVPALRDRIAAIEPLARSFLSRVAQAWGKSTRDITPEALRLLRAHEWPGNVRELRNVIERAVAVADGDSIDVADLPERLHGEPVIAPVTLAPPVSGDALKERHAHEERELIARVLKEVDGSIERAAVQLGWARRTLQRRIQRHGLGRTRR